VIQKEFYILEKNLSKEDLEVREIIDELADFLTGGICDLCGLPEKKHKSRKTGKIVYNKGMSFVIHHHKYLKRKGKLIEKIHSDFKSRLAYHRYLKKQVRKNPKRFKVLHNKCHFAVESTARWNPEKRKKLFKLANETYKNNYT